MEGMNPILLAFLAGCFTWLMTALGAATVFAGRELSKRTLDTMYGFAGGVGCNDSGEFLVIARTFD